LPRPIHPERTGVHRHGAARRCTRGWVTRSDRVPGSDSRVVLGDVLLRALVVVILD